MPGNMDSRAAFAELCSSGEAFRLLIEGIHDDTVCLIDPAGCVASWNSGGRALQQYLPDEIIGQFFGCFYSPEQLEAGLPSDDLAQATRGGRVQREAWQLRKDGSRFWASTALSPIFTADEKVVGFSLVTRDITLVRRNEQRLAALLNYGLDAVLCVTDEGKIQTFNPAAEAMFGLKPEEALGQPISMLMPDSTLDALDGDQGSPAFPGAVHVVGLGKQLSARRGDGTVFPIELAVRHLELVDQHCTMWVIRDVSERCMLEEQLRQSQKMEAVGRLAGGVAHDFNNLLTVITGYSEMLQDEMPESSAHREYVNTVLSASERAAGLTQQLLAFSRQQVLQPRVMNVVEVLSETDKLLRRVLGEDISLMVVSDADLAPIEIDHNQFVQVLLNLAVNARDAMPAGGKLMFEAHNFRLDGRLARLRPDLTTGEYLMLSISDTGSGMPPDVLARVFEPFFTTKEQGKGTGLGLATVYGIVKQSAGHIEVYSEPGVGTKFTLFFPASQRVEQPASPYIIPQGGTERVLLIEDEVLVRQLAISILESAGYIVFAAADGGEALLLHAQLTEPVQILVTDLVMPGMNGRQVAEQLLLRQPELKLLYMSGYSDDEIVRNGLVQENVSFLQKPFTPHSLLLKIRETLDLTSAQV